MAQVSTSPRSAYARREPSAISVICMMDDATDVDGACGSPGPSLSFFWQGWQVFGKNSSCDML